MTSRAAFVLAIAFLIIAGAYFYTQMSLQRFTAIPFEQGVYVLDSKNQILNYCTKDSCQIIPYREMHQSGCAPCKQQKSHSFAEPYSSYGFPPPVVSPTVIETNPIAEVKPVAVASPSTNVATQITPASPPASLSTAPNAYTPMQQPAENYTNTRQY